jgi:hypothetical protein
VTQRQFDAGERLRTDWERAQLAPRTTMAWDAAPVSGRRGGSGTDLDLSGSQIDSKRRFHSAIDAAGPGLSDILWRIVCSGEGMRDAETVLAGRREPGSWCSHSRSNGSRTTIGSVSDAALRPSGRPFGRASPSPLFVRSLSSFPVPIGAPASSGRACCSGIRLCRCDCASHFSHAMTGPTDVRGLISAAQPAAGGSSS